MVVASAGLGIYLAAVELGVNRFVIPAPPLGHWWTVPVLVLNAAEAAVLEEVIVLGFLMTRLRQLSWSPMAAVAASALLRGGYHLYQGWGGFLGNLAMGVLFGVLFLRWRRTWPFVVAHCCSTSPRVSATSCSASVSRFLTEGASAHVPSSLRWPSEEGGCRRCWTTSGGGGWRSWCCPIPTRPCPRTPPNATRSARTRWCGPSS